MKYKSKKDIKTTCSLCNNPLESNRIGKQRYCLSCHNSHYNKTRLKHSQLSLLEKKKANCRSYLNTYIRRGKIKKPNSCSVEGCNNTFHIQAHHHDYNKPLEVTWLCEYHHKQLHYELNNS